MYVTIEQKHCYSYAEKGLGTKIPLLRACCLLYIDNEIVTKIGNRYSKSSYNHFLSMTDIHNTIDFTFEAFQEGISPFFVLPAI